MIQKEISAQVPEKKGVDDEGNEVIKQQALGPVTIFVDYPETLEEAEGWAGGDAILTNAFANFRVNPIQSGIRSALKAGLSQEQIQEKLGTAVMGVAQVGGRVDVQTAFIAKFKMSTPEQQAEMLEKLRKEAMDEE
jgi:hypothetical protein